MANWQMHVLKTNRKVVNKGIPKCHNHMQGAIADDVTFFATV